MKFDKKIALDMSVTHATTAGTATYIYGLLSGMEEKSNDIKIERVNYIKRFSSKQRILKMFDTLRREIFWVHFELPRILKKEKFDLLHSPSLLAPANISVPHVITVHDLYVLKNKSAFNMWQAFSSERLFKKPLFGAQKIIADSYYTKSEILELIPQIPDSKIEVIHLGVDNHFRVVNDSEKEKIRDKYTLSKPYILSVCTIEPRKNLKKVLDALSLTGNKIEHDLVLVGSYGWKSKDLYDYIQHLNIGNRIKFLGFVPKEDLPGLYSAADAFVYASLYEGFGLPPLEAMACGCPVITSNCTSVPEVVGDAGILINPLSKEEISEAIIAVCQSDTLRRELSKKGLERVKTFSWSTCAEKTIKIYKSLIN